VAGSILNKGLLEMFYDLFGNIEEVKDS